MRLGVLISLRSLSEADDRLAQAQNAGFSLCQVNLQGGACDRTEFATLAEKMLERDIRPVAIGCYVNPMRPEEAGPLGAKREDLIRILHQLDIIGARKVVCFSGSYGDTLYDAHPENASDEALQALADFVSGVVAETKARHYNLVLEPWHGHVLSSEDRIMNFHEMLEPAVAEHIRYVVDAAALLTPERYPERDRAAKKVCRSIGPAAGVVHLRDCIMPPDGDPALPGPGQGKLVYSAYVSALRNNVPFDAPAIVRNIPPEEFAPAREFLQRITDDWELA